LKSGETFHAQAPGASKAHLYIALTDPALDGSFVIVNVTSQSQSKDQSCTINVGDHPFIRAESVINYADAIFTNEAAVSKGAKGRVVQYDVPVKPEVLTKVRAGALASPHTETGVKNAIRAAFDQ
jgi:CMP-2-keto-3-deoxyoctulosonic acid synthetase